MFPDLTWKRFWIIIGCTRTPHSAGVTSRKFVSLPFFRAQECRRAISRDCSVNNSDTAVNKISYFDGVAQDYARVRGTEIWSSLLQTLSSVARNPRTVLDIATGTGLFSVRLAQQGFHVIGVERNSHMLTQAIRKAREGDCSFQAVRGLAEQLPLPEKSISTMFSTNAIHHFDFQAHFREVQRVLKPGGYYIVYTRFKKHNARSIWGRLFPHFAEKETRLYNPADFKGLEGECSELVLDSLDELSFEIQFSCDRLLQSARLRKYSTFALYDEAEFWRAFATFRARLQEWSEAVHVAEIGRIVFRRR